MKYLLGLIVIIVAAYFFPQIYEETGNSCQALEKKFVRLNTDAATAGSALGGLALSLTNGDLGRDMAKDEYPSLPRPAACVVAYYNFPEDWRP